MSPRPAQNRRVNKHAKTLHCECDKSYTRADHFERHKRTCQHTSEFVAVSEPAPSSGPGQRPFYCSCGTGYIAAHAFTRHCRRTGHDGDWLRSTYQPRGHPVISAVAEPQSAIHDLVSVAEHQVQVSASDPIPNSPLNGLHADLLLDLGPSDSKDSDLVFPIKGNEPDELHEGRKLETPGFQNPERDGTVYPVPRAMDLGQFPDHSKSDDKSPKEASYLGEFISEDAGGEDESLPILDSPAAASNAQVTNDFTDNRSSDPPVEVVVPTKRNGIKPTGQLLADDAFADGRFHSSFQVLPTTKRKTKPVVEQQSSSRKIRYPKDEPSKHCDSRYSAKEGVRLSGLRSRKQDRFCINKARRLGQRVLKYAEQHKGKITAFIAAVVGAYAVANYGGHSITPPTVASSQDWLLDSTVSRHIARDSSVFSNVYEVQKVCPKTLLTSPCNFSGTVPLKFNNGKHLLLQDVLYRPRAYSNVVSLAKLGEVGLGGEWAANEVTIHNKTDMEFIGRALSSEHGYRLEDLATPASASDCPQVPGKILDDKVPASGTYDATTLPLATTPTWKFGWSGSSPSTTIYPPYLPPVSTSPVVLSDITTAPPPGFDVQSTPTTLHLTSTSDHPDDADITTDLSEANLASTPPPTSTSQQRGSRCTKRPFPSDHKATDMPAAKRPWSWGKDKYLNDLLEACYKGKDNASSRSEVWKLPRWPVVSSSNKNTQTHSMKGTSHDGATSDAVPLAPTNIEITSPRESQLRQRATSPPNISSSSSPTTSTTDQSQLEDHGTGSTCSLTRTQDWGFPTWPSLSPQNVSAHSTQSSLSVKLSAAHKDETSFSSSQTFVTGGADTSASDPPLTPVTTSILSTGLNEFTTTIPTAKLTSSIITSAVSISQRWALPTFSNSFSWIPGPRVNSRNYALAKHAAEKKKAEEKRDELKQKLNDVQANVCPPCPPCEP